MATGYAASVGYAAAGLNWIGLVPGMGSAPRLRHDTFAVVLVEDDTVRGHPAYHWATSAFITGPDDTPAHQLFDRLSASVEIVREVGTLYWGNDRVSNTISAIKIRNEDGALDDVDEDVIRDRPVLAYYGRRGEYFSDFRLVATAVADRLDCPDEQEAQLVVLDRGAKLERALSTNLYAAPANDALDGRVKPIAIGKPLSCPVPLVTPASLYYDVHDSVPSGIDIVRDKGVELTPVTQWIGTANGFELQQQPAGDIVADPQGPDDGSTLITRLPDVLHYLLVTRGGLSSGDLDTASINALDAAAPYDLSLWIDRPTTIAEVLDAVMDSYGGWWFFNRSGKFQVGRLEAPAGSPDLTIAEWQLDRRPIRRWLDRATGFSTAVVGARNYHVYTAGQLATSLLSPTVTQIALDLQQQYRRRRVGATSAASEYAHAVNARGGGRTETERTADGMPTLFNDEAALQAEATRRCALYSVKRRFYEIPVRLQVDDALLLDPGMQVHVTAGRFGLAAGKLLRVVGIRMRIRDSAITLKCWG